MKSRLQNGRYKKTNYFTRGWYDWTVLGCVFFLTTSCAITLELNNDLPEITIAKAETSAGVVLNDAPLADSFIATTSATPAPALELSDKQEVMTYILEVFGDDADRAIWVAKCESGLRKTAINDKNPNGTTDYGVFQINSVHAKKRGEAFKTDWKANVDTAKQIYDEQGFRPWVCAKSIGEKNYLSSK